MAELTEGAVLGGCRLEARVDSGPDVEVWRARGAEGAYLVLALRFVPERAALDRLALLKPAARPSPRLDTRALAELAQDLLTARSGNAPALALPPDTARALASALAPDGNPTFASATDLVRALWPAPPRTGRTAE